MSQVAGRGNSGALPIGVLRQAAAAIASSLRNDPNVIAVGFGFKHRKSAYVTPARPCIRVHVTRKFGGAPTQVTPLINVAHRGQRFRVATDVEEVGGARLHSVACAKSSQVDVGGTFFGVGEANGQRYGLTAGHVLGRTSNGARVYIDQLPAGYFLKNASLLRSGADVIDVGVFTLDPTEDWDTAPPWKWFNKVESLSSLSRLFSSIGDAIPRGIVFSRRGPIIVEFDTFIPYAVKFRGGLPPHMAPILFYRAVDGRLGPGCSGSPVTDIAGKRLLGLHVAGNETKGYAHPAAVIIDVLRARLVPTFRLLP